MTDPIPLSKHFIALFSIAVIGSEALAPANAVAKDIDEIAPEIEQLVDSSLQEYQSLEESIAEEKVPMVIRLSELEEANLQLRSEVESYRFLSDKLNLEIGELTEEGRALTSQVDYVESALENFLVKFESRINMAEGQRYFDELESLRAKTSDPQADVSQRFEGFVSAMEMSLQRAERALGGELFPGKAIDSEGRIFAGQVAIWGPSSYFLSDDTQQAGVMSYNPGALEPGVTFLEGEAAGALAAFITNRSGEVPLDATLGDALTFEVSRGNVVSHIKQGGIVGYFILLLGAIAAGVSLVKLRDLKGFSAPSAETIEELSRLAQEDKMPEAASKLEAIPGVAKDVLATGLRNINKNVLLLEETMLSVILRAKPKMERYLPFLAITAAASPLLGLLGTVVGLIKTFALITLYGAGAPNALSSGISEALITTELGLIVAIPTLILHGLFSRVIRTRIGVLEQVAFDFVETTNVEAPRKEA
ncbi:MotA/TolQ/ExbB proton channel family protein [Pelagicoccus enzymogenes]|uniref:MotA/TolQ/ExbB proton channel family protein n=1 Tax=Pelagicoccus enzymogenes TaxID=2773457 RepID=UPI00280E2D2F|nr:MotA/TolQ/ExbB proton channel family protein [Pelagicoccus enzymogenes]MDQ8198727.1 MotA/TolQ/ExbB proton channel family protein [Pelagicoccus enzymogenes]